MNITSVIIDQFTIYILPPLIGFVCFAVVRQLKKAAEYLPSNVRKLLWDYANTAVKSVETEHGYRDLTTEEKRNYAKEILVSLLSTTKAKVPDALMDRVILQIEYEMGKRQET